LIKSHNHPIYGGETRLQQAVIFEVWRLLVMTKQRVLAGTEASADLGAFLVWR